MLSALTASTSSLSTLKTPFLPRSLLFSFGHGAALWPFPPKEVVGLSWLHCFPDCLLAAFFSPRAAPEPGEVAIVGRASAPQRPLSTLPPPPLLHSGRGRGRRLVLGWLLRRGPLRRGLLRRDLLLRQRLHLRLAPAAAPAAVLVAAHVAAVAHLAAQAAAVGNGWRAPRPLGPCGAPFVLALRPLQGFLPSWYPPAQC